jgi:hypothetical protein
MTIHQDLTANIVKALPHDVKEMMKEIGPGICVAGGFCRDAFLGTVPKDIDVFAIDKETMFNAIDWFEWNAKEYDPYLKQTVNSVSCVPDYDHDVPPIQFVTRVYYRYHVDLIESFDWSICQIALYYLSGSDRFECISTDEFARDIQQGTLHYTAPIRDEDPGASVIRMLKLTQRGWKPTEESIARCLARFCAHLNNYVDYFKPSDEPMEEQYFKDIKSCFRNVGYAGKKGTK